MGLLIGQRNLLDLSRGDSGRLAITKEPMRLANQLEQVAVWPATP